VQAADGLPGIVAPAIGRLERGNAPG